MTSMSSCRSSPPSKWRRATRSSASPKPSTPTPNPNKVNLGVGVYYDDNGKVPLLECVQQRRSSDDGSAAAPRSYLPIDGIAAYDTAVQELVFGADSPSRQGRPRRHRAGARRHRRPEDRRRLPASASSPTREVWISDPSWENHRALFEGAGFAVDTLSLLRRRRRTASTSTACWRRSKRCRAGAIVVLHACCHNPTGVDLTADAVGPRCIEVVQRARPGAVPRHRLPGLRRRHRRRRAPRCALFADARPGCLRLELVLEVASRSTASASARCQRRRRRATTKRRACCRQLKRVDPHQLLEPADPRRPGRRHGARRRRSCARCGNRSSAGMRERIKRDAPAAASTSSQARAPERDFSFVIAAARHVLATRA